MSSIQVYTEDEARASLESARWGGVPTCSHCGVQGDCYKLEPKPGARRPVRPGCYHCRACRRQFTVTTGTLLHGTRMPLEKWAQTIDWFLAHREDLNASEVARRLGIQYRSAWRAVNLLRETGGRDFEDVPLGAIGGTRAPAGALSRSWVYANMDHPAHRKLTEVWPFLRGMVSESEGHRILGLVSELMPKGLPETIRGEVGQEISVALLTGELSESDIESEIPAFIRQIYREYSTHRHLPLVTIEDRYSKPRSVSDQLISGRTHKLWDLPALLKGYDSSTPDTLPWLWTLRTSYVSTPEEILLRAEERPTAEPPNGRGDAPDPGLPMFTDYWHVAEEEDDGALRRVSIQKREGGSCSLRVSRMGVGVTGRYFSAGEVTLDDARAAAGASLE